MDQPESILIMRLGAIGDCLRVLPALAALRRAFPNAKIGWAVEHWVLPVLADHPMVDRFHVLNRKQLRAGSRPALKEMNRHIAEIRAEQYQVLLDFHGRAKSGWIGWRSGIPLRIGYAKGQSTEKNHWFTNHQVRLEDPLENRVSRFLHLLEPLGVQASFDPKNSGIFIPEPWRNAARAWYGEVGKPALAAYPGCSKHQAAYHRWPVEKWVELLRRLDGDGTQTVLFWGPDEADYVRTIHQQAGVGLLAPNTKLVEMMAMLGQFRAFIGTNSAAMHMAWLQGVPSAFFSGPALPKTDGPLNPVLGVG
ncbi:MAG: glycosyltransferase family 9 protein, partial [Acidobacteria bacterium]|nr:glycosyltransferase family 9 protein [Acidobacteriota bacterium]